MVSGIGATGLKAIKPRFQAPKWLAAARNLPGAHPPNPRQILNIIDGLRMSLSVIIMVEGREVSGEFGLEKQIGKFTSMTDAHKALVEIAANGLQIKETAIELEDAVALMNKRLAPEIALLAEMHEIRGEGRYLKTFHQAEVTVESGELLHELKPIDLYNFISGLSFRLGERTLSGIISEWKSSEGGWQLLHDSEPGTYQLADILSDTIV